MCVLVAAFRDIPDAKGLVATKLVNRELPEGLSKVVHMRMARSENSRGDQ